MRAATASPRSSADRRSTCRRSLRLRGPLSGGTSVAPSASGSVRSISATRAATATRGLRGTVRATEALGSELLVHLEVLAEPVVTEEVRAAAADVDAAAVERLESEAFRTADAADRATRDASPSARRRAARGRASTRGGSTSSTSTPGSRSTADPPESLVALSH